MSVLVRRLAAGALLFAGLALLGRPAWTNHQERVAQGRLARQFAASPAPVPAADSLYEPAEAPTSQTAPPPTPQAPPVPPRIGPQPPVYAQLEIPAIGLDAYAVDGARLEDYEAQLAWGPAHLEGTPGPGAAGNAVIFGHRDEYGAPFRNLFRLKPGDEILLRGGGQTYRYQVLATRTASPTDVSVVGPIGGASALTLVTCTGVANAQRLVVRALLERGGPNPATAGLAIDQRA